MKITASEAVCQVDLRFPDMNRVKRLQQLLPTTDALKVLCSVFIKVIPESLE